MNANEITFGVEIETFVPVGAVMVGAYHVGVEVPALPGWKAMRDSSIEAEAGYVACEFVSPVLRGPEGLLQVVRAVEWIKSIGGKVNASCGLHVHVGFDKSDVRQVAKLATLVSNFEKAIFATTGTKARERGGWCQGLNRHGSVEQAICRARMDRRHVANFAGRLPTVEFRAFAGTLNAVKLVGYVRLCVGLVERALKAKRVTNWTAKVVKETSPIHRSGEGQTALTRLFYQLGWIKGRTAETFGVIECDGVPGMKAVKREFVRLAKKYDGQA